MIYFLYGDPNKTFKKSAQTTEVLLNKKPDAALFKLNSDNFSIFKLEELIGGQGLFSNKYIVNCSRLLESSEIAEIVFQKIKDIKESENIFIWVEENIKSSELKKIEKYCDKIQSFDIAKKIESKKMNIFDLANAFAMKDKKNAWILYQKALKEFSPEEIYGTLWWQIKTMLIASKTKTAAEADMKDFPYQKAKTYAKNFTDSELDNLAKKIISLYHKSRLESEDLTINLERLILEK
jgi:hypothetical protein